jgi:hypothetical protein
MVMDQSSEMKTRGAPMARRRSCAVSNEGNDVTTLIEVFRCIAQKSGGIPAPALNNSSDEPFAARSLDERKAVRDELDQLEADGERKGIALARELERAIEASKAAERAADEARKLVDRAKTVRDAHGWGLEVRKSKLRAELARGAPSIIDATIAELARHWETARVAGRHTGALRAPLTDAEVADNAAADAHLAGLVTAQSECDALRFEALSDADLAAALERIIRAIPSRYPREAVAIELPKANGSARPRATHRAVA